MHCHHLSGFIRSFWSPQKVWNFRLASSWQGSLKPQFAGVGRYYVLLSLWTDVDQSHVLVDFGAGVGYCCVLVVLLGRCTTSLVHCRVSSCEQMSANRLFYFADMNQSAVAYVYVWYVNTNKICAVLCRYCPIWCAACCVSLKQTPTTLICWVFKLDIDRYDTF